MLFDNRPAVVTSKSGLCYRHIAFPILNQPIQIGFAPAVAGQAIEGKRMVVTLKLLNCPHADH